MYRRGKKRAGDVEVGLVRNAEVWVVVVPHSGSPVHWGVGYVSTAAWCYSIRRGAFNGRVLLAVSTGRELKGLCYLRTSAVCTGTGGIVACFGCARCTNEREGQGK
jgi:hypothetical protein